MAQHTPGPWDRDHEKAELVAALREALSYMGQVAGRVRLSNSEQEMNTIARRRICDVLAKAEGR
jgi:hypothetical protein